MSIFVRQLGAITCEVKFDGHCNWIVTVIAWNVPFPPASLILDADSRGENKDVVIKQPRKLRKFETTSRQAQVSAARCASVSPTCGTWRVCGI